MCITVGGTKRNLRIGIPNPIQKQKITIVRRRVFTHRRNVGAKDFSPLPHIQPFWEK
ncbi:MAG: hypothetical protein LBU34_00300 [Planctomycetaceae bacterium]|nr:hypothetical protein [Planctomycetaceae bacterium]